MKWRSSKTTSEPSSSDGSTAPQAVQPTTAVAPSSFNAQMFARCVTWLESRTWPGPCREACSVCTPA